MTYYSYVSSIISGVEKPPTPSEENPPDHGYIERLALITYVTTGVERVRTDDTVVVSAVFTHL